MNRMGGWVLSMVYKCHTMLLVKYIRWVVFSAKLMFQEQFLMRDAAVFFRGSAWGFFRRSEVYGEDIAKIKDKRTSYQWSEYEIRKHLNVSLASHDIKKANKNKYTTNIQRYFNGLLSEELLRREQYALPRCTWWKENLRTSDNLHKVWEKTMSQVVKNIFDRVHVFTFTFVKESFWWTRRQWQKLTSQNISSHCVHLNFRKEKV